MDSSNARRLRQADLALEFPAELFRQETGLRTFRPGILGEGGGSWVSDRLSSLRLLLRYIVLHIYIHMNINHIIIIIIIIVIIIVIVIVININIVIIVIIIIIIKTRSRRTNWRVGPSSAAPAAAPPGTTCSG